MFLFQTVETIAIILIRCAIMYWTYLLLLENLLSLPKITFGNVLGGYIIILVLSYGFFRPTVVSNTYFQRSEAKEEDL